MDELSKMMAGQIMDHPPADPPGHYLCLYGLPIAVKDLCDVQGVRTTYGSPILKDNIAQQPFLFDSMGVDGPMGRLSDNRRLTTDK